MFNFFDLVQYPILSGRIILTGDNVAEYLRLEIRNFQWGI